MIPFLLNNKTIRTEMPAGSLLLDFIRYHQHLTGTKIGCREGDCGACTVLVGELINDEVVYRSATSCLMPIGNVAGKHVVTIEGINNTGLNFIQQAFAEEGAAQCGFCTPGFIVSLTGHCLNNKSVGNQTLTDAIDGNICRCTGYKSIERAVEKLNSKLADRAVTGPIDFAIQQLGLPGYFKTITNSLSVLASANGTAKHVAAAPQFLGGGTDLYVQHPEKMGETDIHFLSNNCKQKGIEMRGNTCILGGSITVTDILESAVFQSAFPLLNKYIKLIASTQIRNMATVAGNFVNASPIGDLTIFFLALDAQLTLIDGENQRTVPLRKFFKGYKILDKKDTEYIDRISFELPGKHSMFNFEKVSKRTNLDIASVNSAIHLTMDNETISSALVSAGGVGPVPACLERSSAFLEDKIISPELIGELLEVVQEEISPISDTRGTATYKRLLLSQLIKAHFVTLFPQIEVDNLIYL